MKRFEVVTLNRCVVYSWIIFGHLALFYLLATWQWQLLLISLFVHYLIAVPGISMTYHRSIAHNAVQLPRWLEFIGLFLAGLSMQGSALSWAATHRQHHRFQGKEKDPHSPKYLGSWYIHIFGYSFSKVDPRSVVKLLQTHHRYWHKYYYWIYVPILLGSLIVLPVNLALAIFFAPIALIFQFENFINTWTHSWDKDIPVNVPVVNLFLGGEAWHENHHNRPGDVRFHKYDLLGYLLEKFFIKNKPIKI
jgi:stearoyl-CoA desaturase (delta-9 desaturase)